MKKFPRKPGKLASSYKSQWTAWKTKKDTNTKNMALNPSPYISSNAGILQSGSGWIGGGTPQLSPVSSPPQNNLYNEVLKVQVPIIDSPSNPGVFLRDPKTNELVYVESKRIYQAVGIEW